MVKMPGSNCKRKTSNVGRTKRKRTDDVEESEPLAKKQATKNQSSTPILKLPEELLTKIFNLIPVAQWPSLETVSRQFQSATYQAWRGIRQLRLDEFILKKDLMMEDRSDLLIDVLEKFCNCAPNIRSISGFSTIFPQAFYSTEPQEMPAIVIHRMTVAFKQLETIDFSNSQISMTNLTDFLTASNSRGSLKSIDITSMRGDHPDRLAQAFNQGHQQLKLEVLKIKYLPRNESQFLSDILLPWLTSFNGSYVYCTSAQLTTFVLQSPLIEHLIFQTEIWEPGSPSPPHQLLFNTVAALENLSVLKISILIFQKECSLFQQALINLIQSLGHRGKLIEFGLSDWNYFNNGIVRAIGNNLVGLAALKLSIGGCSVESIKNLASNLIHLKRVCFNSSIISSSFISALGDFASLECLHLKSILSTGYLPSLKFDGLARHRDLKEIRIDDDRMSNSGLRALAKTIGPQLEILELTSFGDNGVTAGGLNALIKKSPNVLRLVVRDSRMGYSVLQAISTNCPLLEYLELEVVKQVKAANIQAIVDQCPRLKYLKIVSTNMGHLEEIKIPKYRKIELVWEMLIPFMR